MSTENTTEGDLCLQEPRLCSRCRTLDSDDTEVKRFPFRLSQLDRTCHLCLYLRDLLLKEDLPTDSTCVLLHNKGYRAKSFESRSDDSLRDLASIKVLRNGSMLDKQVGWLAEYSESSSYPDDAIIPRLVDSRKANFDFIKDWMNHCVLKHDCGLRLTFTGTIPNQHVIDCYTKKVIPAPLGCDYAALSYVWGGDQTTFHPGDTLDAVPKTIQDAMQVTRIMGITYLWVDRYCIPQDNARHKMEQIRSMHKIYSNAKFTIVAAAGYGPDYGLPGVSDRNRYEQPRVRLGSRLMVSTLPSPSNAICSNKWWTRGWTYQECIHSRRLLFFTEEQVYFQCNKASFRESFHCPANKGVQPDPIFGTDQGPDIWLYIHQYLERDLTFPSDILNAILSILQRFQETDDEDDFRHIWGLPVQRHSFYGPGSWNKALGEALLWNFEKTAARREDFPSWSWTGWFGRHITAYDTRLQWEKLYPQDFLQDPEFMVNVSNSRLISLDAFFNSGSDTEDPSPVLQVTAIVFRLRIESGVSKSGVETDLGRSVYALDAEEKPIFLSEVLEKALKQGFYNSSSGCSLDKAVEDSEACYLGIFMGSNVSMKCGMDGGSCEVPDSAFLLVVEQKEVLFEKIGVCQAPYDTVLRADMQVQTIRLG